MIKKSMKFILCSILMILSFQPLFGQINPPFAEMIHLTHDSGDGGSVTFVLNGNPDEYNYYWTHGATELSLTGLLPGTYTLVVQDYYGCIQEFEVTILFIGSCELVTEVLNGDLVCTKILSIQVLVGGEIADPSNLNIEWQDGSNAGLSRLVSTETNGTYCVAITVIGAGNNCSNLDHCFEIERDRDCFTAQECRLVFRVEDDPHDQCIKTIITEVEKDGQPYEDDYFAKWLDNGSQGLIRHVYADEDTEYCIEVLMNGCEFLEGCVSVPGKPGCLDCELDFEVNTDVEDQCKKIIDIQITQKGQPCEGDYIVEWIPNCAPEVSIEIDTISTTYSIDLVNQNNDELQIDGWG